MEGCTLTLGSCCITLGSCCIRCAEGCSQAASRPQTTNYTGRRTDYSKRYHDNTTIPVTSGQWVQRSIALPWQHNHPAVAVQSQGHCTATGMVHTDEHNDQACSDGNCRHTHMGTVHSAVATGTAYRTNHTQTYEQTNQNSHSNLGQHFQAQIGVCAHTLESVR